MKYIMLEHTQDDITRRIPIIFPDSLVHSDVADHMCHLIRRSQGFEVKPVSAGFIDLIATRCHGDSETLKLKANGEEDSLLINTLDYLHGIVE